MVVMFACPLGPIFLLCLNSFISSIYSMDVYQERAMRRCCSGRWGHNGGTGAEFPASINPPPAGTACGPHIITTNTLCAVGVPGPLPSAYSGPPNVIMTATPCGRNHHLLEVSEARELKLTPTQFGAPGQGRKLCLHTPTCLQNPVLNLTFNQATCSDHTQTHG